MTVRIAPLSLADPVAVETLLDEAFGGDRHQRTAYRLRAGMTAIPALSLAAFDGETVVGTLQSWPVALDALPLVLVGPVAVRPGQQRGGIGRAMMTALLAPGVRDPLVMIGDPEYYGRFFGFTSDATQHWVVPGPVERHRLLCRSDGVLPVTGVLGPRVAVLV
ncbi:GNAT family N-acetyltransferase [Sphingomonas sp.]|uniref:GNAT family N-acetyltransferase n=1 Tax=Sphingomonas sp. TaxID=28214 RepID=UPI0025E87B05|nr:N-acetyltransferase [Sphingomonas sp.]